MSGLLASVCNLQESRLVRWAGADIIDLKDPGSGVLGALEDPLVETIVKDVNRHAIISATIGDLPFEARAIGPGIRKKARCGVNMVKVGVFGEADNSACLKLLARLSAEGIPIVLVLFAEYYHPSLDIGRLARAGIHGVMLDTADKHRGGLRDKLADAQLADFVGRSRAHGLVSGLAGSLGLEDIPHLLALEPDYLGFRGALCRAGKRQAVVDREAVMAVRGRIPAELAIRPETAAIMQSIDEE